MIPNSDWYKVISAEMKALFKENTGLDYQENKFYFRNWARRKLTKSDNR